MSNSMETEYTHEMAGSRLKYKYRCRKPVSGFGSKSQGQGKPLHGTPPQGMPRRYRGKTSYR